MTSVVRPDGRSYGGPEGSHSEAEVTEVRGALRQMIGELRELRDSAPAREVEILDQYAFHDPPRKYLERLGEEFGVSRERIRQLKNRLLRRIEERVGGERAAITAAFLREAGPVVGETDYEAQLDALFTGVGGRVDRGRSAGRGRGDGLAVEDPAVDLVRRIVVSDLGYDRLNGVCASPAAAQALAEFYATVKRLADRVGLIDEESVLDALPEGPQWQQRTDLVFRRFGLARVSGSVALRYAHPARVKAAILSIGRPASADEIVAASGVVRKKLAFALKRIPGIVRADKERWAFSEWIDDEYTGIASEIEQRIVEDGGTTSVERLVEELPRMFGIREGSVRSTLGAPRFVVKDGQVRFAKESEIKFRDLDEVAPGFTEEGWRYWLFCARDRHFEGYSKPMPREVAVALGCPPDGRIWADVVSPEGCRSVSINWRLTSISGASIGYISGPLRGIGARDGDDVQLVLRGKRKVEFRLHP